MKTKKAIVLAVLMSAGITSGYAQSNVTLYGIVDDGVQYLNHVGVVQRTGAKGRAGVYQNESSVSLRSGALYADRWGLKGVEDLGGGLAAVFQVENGFNIDTGAFSSSGIEFNRQAYVGLSGKYGAVTFGRQYEAMTDMLLLYGNDFGSGSGTYPGDISNLDDSIRVNNAIKFETVAYNGFTGEVLYGLGGNAGSIGSGSTLSVGANYVNGPVALGAAYLRMQNNYASANAWAGSADGNFNSSVTAGYVGARTIQIVGAVAQYTFGALTLGTNYGFTQYRPSAVSSFTKQVAYNSVGFGAKYYLTPAWRIGGSAAYTIGQAVQYGSARPQYENIAANTLYSLSKRTAVYLIVGYQHAKGSTVDAYGNVVAATASIGDSANGASSGSGSQFMVRVGVSNKF